MTFPCSCRLIQGTHICDYEGELLNTEQFNQRYPDGVVGTGKTTPFMRMYPRTNMRHLIS